MSFRFSRRFLFVPAWLWLLPPLGLILVVRSLGPPTEVPEPREAAEIFREILFFTPDGNSFRFFNFADSKGISPLWALTHQTVGETDVSWFSGFNPAAEDHPGHFGMGFYQLSGRWTYKLAASRFDETRPEGGRDWLAESELERVRPLAVAELNRRFPGEKRGDRLNHLLTRGTVWSGWFCKENVLILLTWLSVLLALVAIVSMFVPPGRRATVARLKPLSHS